MEEEIDTEFTRVILPEIDQPASYMKVMSPLVYRVIMEFSDKALERFVLSPRNILVLGKYFRVIFYENDFPMEKIDEIKDRLNLLVRIFRENKNIKHLMFRQASIEMILVTAMYKNGEKCSEYYCCESSYWELLVEKFGLIKDGDYYTTTMINKR